jgi:formylglycine-generating enzyme required for sulfatase activity
LIWIPGGTFRMGSDKHYPEEASVHRVTVDGFWIDRTPVTNREFRTFVDATGHVTFAEIPPDPKDYPGALSEMLYAGSLVFSPPTRNVDLRDWSQWWAFLKGADWRHPLWSQQQYQWARQSSSRARVVRRRAGIRPIGGQGLTDRGRMGVCCARRTRWRGVCLGR